MHEWHHASPEELGEQQPLTGHSPCEHRAKPHHAKGSHHLLQQTPIQTLLRLWLKRLRSDSLENNSPRAALFALWVLQLRCAFMFNKRHVLPASLRELRHSLQHGRSDFPGFELTEHIPVQPTYIRSGTSGTRNCINKFTQLNWPTPPGYSPQFAPKPPLSCGKSTFSFKTYICSSKTSSNAYISHTSN